MRKSNKRRNIIIIAGVAVVLIVIAGIFISGRISDRNAMSAEGDQSGDTVTAFVGDLSASAGASGKVVPQRDADLALGISGRVEDVFVQVGDEVSSGDKLVQLETGALERNVKSAEQNLIIQEINLSELFREPSAKEIASAEAQLASAQTQIDDLMDGPSEEEIANAQAGVDAAQANVWGASAQVGQVSSGASEAEIAAAEQQVAVAQQQYDQAKQAHDRTLECFESPTGEEVCPLLGPAEEAARANMNAAAANLSTAQAQLDALASGPDVNAVSSAQANVSAAASQRDSAQAQLDLLLKGASEGQLASARAQLAQAEASLALMLDGPTEQQVARVEAQVEQARIVLEEAQDNLAKATLEAPFDGVVTAVLVARGENAAGVAVRLVDAGTMEVVLDVDEVDIGNLAVDQPAVVTLEAWPNVEIQSEVVAIAPSANTNAATALVSYEVHLSLADTELPVLVGMTANADLVTAEREDVLLLANQAINVDRSTGTYTVNLVTTDADGNRTITEVEVTIGLRDGDYTQITSGLQPGDEVVIGFVAPVFEFGPGSDNDEDQHRPFFGGGGG
jgi:HlyD family secretion protein